MCPLLRVTPAPTPAHLSEPAQRGKIPPWVLVSDRWVIRLQAWGQVYRPCHHPRPVALGPWLPLHLGALGLARDHGPGPLGRPGPREMLLTAPALPAAPAYLGGQERPPGPPAGSGSPQRLQPLGRGKGLLGPLSSAWDGAPSRCLSRGLACDSPALLSGAEPGRGRASGRRGRVGAEPGRGQPGTRPREGQSLI